MPIAILGGKGGFGLKGRVTKIPYFYYIFAHRPCTDDLPAKSGAPLSTSCKCANHPSSGMPSRVFRIAFTACGLALPPVAFIT